jgi:hypothetical protein
MKTKPLALLTLALLPSFFTPANADLKDGLVAHYSFDDCTAKDNSGNGNDGNIKGILGITADYNCVDGVKNKALFFNKKGYVWFPYSFNNFTEFSMILWSTADDDPMSPFALMAVIYDKNEVKIYSNGNLTDTYKRAGLSFSSFNEGKSLLGGDGLLDEASMYNRALTEAEVMELYNGKTELTYTPEPDPTPIIGTMPDPKLEASGLEDEKENIVGSLCGITNKTHQTDMLKLVEVDMTNSLIFPSSIDTVSNYKTLLTQKNIANKTTKQLYSQIYSLEKKNKKLLSETMGSITAKDGKAWSNFLKSKEVSEKINKLSADRAIAVGEYNILKTQLKNTPSPSFINKTGTVTSGLLTAYGTACGLYEMYEDVSNVFAGDDLAYNTLNFSWHAINVAGGSLSLWELATNVPNATSKVLSRSAAFLLVPQVVALGYEWARDNTLYEQVDNILKTHSSTLELRYFMVDQIVDELAKYRTGTPLDNLRYSIMTILGKYPNVYRNDGTLFDADKEFISFLSNEAFLQKNFGKSQYEKLTPPELASVAAVYILGEAATWENMTLKITTIKNLTKMPVWNKPSTWGDILPAAFNGKDSFTIFSDLRTQVITALNYNVYDNLRTRFDSSFVKQRILIERQIGEKIHYYEQF